jgi:hypothetical protein
MKPKTLAQVFRSSFIDRRSFLGNNLTALGAMALVNLSRQEVMVQAAPPMGQMLRIDAARPFAARPTHFAPKAQRVLVIFCAGACSQLETWDYKPVLARMDGKTFEGAPTVTFQGPSGNLAQPQYAFRQRGACGKWVSDMIPHLGELVDDFAFVHSFTSKSNTHGPAENFLSTGNVLDGFPSMGSWATYALGSENEDLPAFVAIQDPRGVPQASVNNWGPGFLPAVFQGTTFSTTQPIDNLKPPSRFSMESDQAARGFLKSLNDQHLRDSAGNDQLAARIASYELAARMQLAVPEVTDLSRESASTLAAYGADSKNQIKADYARNCILARRLIESGVRFVQLFNGAYASGGELNWDGHQKLRQQYDVHGQIMDQPTAALITDLKQRGLLHDTLVVWCTEFGRMPMFQQGAQGRDHNPQGFTAVLAGAGVKAGVSHGATDELGFQAVEHVHPLHDLHATMLHLLGLDHERLTYNHNGFDRRLTDVHGNVIHEVLA